MIKELKWTNELIEIMIYHSINQINYIPNIIYLGSVPIMVNHEISEATGQIAAILGPWNMI